MELYVFADCYSDIRLAVEMEEQGCSNFEPQMSGSEKERQGKIYHKIAGHSIDHRLAMAVAGQFNNGNSRVDNCFPEHHAVKVIGTEKQETLCQKANTCNNEFRLAMEIAERLTKKTDNIWTSEQIGQVMPNKRPQIEHSEQTSEELEECNSDTQLAMKIAARWNNKNSNKLLSGDLSTDEPSLQTKGELKTETPGKSIRKMKECNVCNKTFTRGASLTRHMRLHTGEKPFVCGICGLAFRDNRQLTGHFAHHTGEKLFKCQLCDSQFLHKISLQQHFRKHTGETPYECPECDKGFIRKDALHSHMQIHTGEKLYVCEICSRAFTRNGNLQQHMRIHTGIRPHTCTICGKSFSFGTTLKRHLNTHSDEKLHQCEKCDCHFSRKYSLIYHVMSKHMDMKAFSCDICYAAFLSDEELLTHQELHSADKTQKCLLCQVSFREAHELKEHMPTHAGEQTCICGTCNKAFKEKKALTVHLRKHTDSIMESTMESTMEVLKQNVEVIGYIPDSTV